MIKKYDVRKIMKDAWIQAQSAAFIHGGEKSEYFRFCLKASWAFEKMLNAPVKKAVHVEKTVDEIQEIKNWFVRKNFDRDEAYVIETNDWIEVIAETAKAYKLRIHNADLGNLTTWAPKSCCVA